MRRIILLLFCFGISLHPFCQVVCGGASEHVSEFIQTQEHIEYGGVFTPKGSIRILVIFIKYGGIYDTMSVDGWDANADRPQWAMANPPVFYGDYSDFSSSIYSGNNRKCISDFYYQMSNGLFRMIADYYGTTITLNPALSKDKGEFHKMVLEQIPKTFDWSRYDNRANRQYFLTDNSNTSSDSIVDYVVFCHRFNHNWRTFPAEWLRGINYDGVSNTATGKYRISQTDFYVEHGFSYLSGGMEPIFLFPHELGHELYDGPHYNGGNGVAGHYFYMPNGGWGMMSLGNNYTSAMGWERYVLDWIPQISASSVISDIENESDLSITNGVYTLRDFITTGDVIRIKVPADAGKHQYLWLENHYGLSIFDGAMHGGMFCGDSTSEFKRGLVSYVEEYSHVKDEAVVNIISRGNAIRLLSRNGNYDFSFIPTETQYAPICGNVSYPMCTGLENPLGGQSVNDFIRGNFNNDDTIGHNTHWNNPGKSNERAWAVDVNGEPPTARWITGTGMQFHAGDKVGIATNPTIKNMPEYNKNTCKMGDYYLNGISFEVLSENADGSMKVKVRLDDVAVDRDVRWAAASIVLGDITGDSRPDVDVQSNIKLTIDMSGTPNRHKNPDNPNHTPSVEEDFITPTTFTCRSGSYFKQEPYSVVDVKASSSLVIDSGAVYEVGDHAVLKVADNSTLHVKRGATLRVHGAGRVEIGDMGYICIEDGAHIHLVDTLSAVTLMPNVTYGVYAGGSAAAGNCTNIDLVQYPLQAGSKGKILKFYNGTKYIQRKIYTKNAYVHGSQIYAGGNVIPLLPSGDVVIKNGAHVIWDAVNDVHLEPGVRVEAGGALEVR